MSISTRVTILISGDEGSLEGENCKSAMLIIENSHVSVVEFVPFPTFCSQSVATLNELARW